MGFTLVALMPGCSPKVSQTEMPVDTPETFSYSGNQDAPGKWWTSFNDQRLNTLVDSALSSNFNILTAWEQLKEARAIADRESGYLLPDIEGYSQAGIQRPEPDFEGGESIQLGLSAFYEIDLWGRINSRVKAERFRAQASYLDYKTAAISLSAEITRTYYRLMAAQQQLQVINEQIETNKTTLQLLKNRFGTGQIRSADILRQQQLLESTKEQKVDAKAQIEVLKNRLGVLLGNAPQRPIDYPTDSLPDLPPLPETGIPTDLVQRRPDVQSAFYRVKAANQEVAAAISNQYPRLTISATSAFRSNTINDLFQNWAQSFTGNLLAPIFYGGRLSAEVDRTKAVKQQRIYQYGQTVLTAFREVENALTQEQQQKKKINKIQNQLELANKTFKQLRLEYFNGMTDYLDVLDQLNQKQQLQRDLINARLTLLEYRISLYRALAGGFETERETNNN